MTIARQLDVLGPMPVRPPRPALVLLALLGAGLLAAGSPRAWASAGEPLREAQLALVTGDCSRALALSADLLETNLPAAHLPARLVALRIAVACGEGPSVRAQLEEELASAAGQPDAALLLARFPTAPREVRRAHADQALERAPRDPRALVSALRIALESGQLGAARELAERLDGLVEARPPASWALPEAHARLALSRGAPGEAVQALIGLGSDDPAELLALRARALLDQEQLRAARTDAEAARFLAPALPLAHEVQIRLELSRPGPELRGLLEGAAPLLGVDADLALTAVEGWLALEELDRAARLLDSLPATWREDHARAVARLECLLAAARQDHPALRRALAAWDDEASTEHRALAALLAYQDGDRERLASLHSGLPPGPERERTGHWLQVLDDRATRLGARNRFAGLIAGVAAAAILAIVLLRRSHGRHGGPPGTSRPEQPGTPPRARKESAP